MKSAAACLCALLAFTDPGSCQEKHPGPTDAERSQLTRDKIVISTRQLRQSFEPCVNNPLPVFITSDAVLNAFHVIFEESVARLEATNVPKLESLLDQIIKAFPAALSELKAPPALKSSAAQRAEIFIKTAARLLGRSAPGFSKDVEQIIAAQVKEIESATGTRLPEWLGPPDRTFLALDFTRYAPRGFYTRSPQMQRYFRAVAWLQSVPFRVAKDEEFTAALLLGRAFGHSRGGRRLPLSADVPFFQSWGELLPGRDDPDLREMTFAAWAFENMDLAAEGDLATRRSEILRLLFTNDNYGFANDQLLLPPVDTAAGREAAFRFLPSSALPDTILFQKTTSLARGTIQRYPDPLEITAALGSVWATARLNLSLPGEIWSEVHPAIKWMSARKPSASLYDEYLSCLRELVNEPDPAAPKFMSGEPWQRKSCQTLLGSWTQMRHTLLLQSKLLQQYLGGVSAPPGFVEPDPEFFHLLGDLSVRCLTFCLESGVSDDNAEFIIIGELQAARDAADVLCKSNGKLDSDSGTYAINRASWRIGESFPLPDFVKYPDREPGTDAAAREKQVQEYHVKLAAWAAQFRDALDKPLQQITAAAPAARAALLAKMNRVESLNLTRRWQGLIKICSRAQSIAHSQLRQRPLTEEQKTFITDFGKLLAQAMFHDGNSYIHPRDDAPRIADVFSGAAGHLHAAIGRPRILYVLYPWNGAETLCAGSVLPFYEIQARPRSPHRRSLDGTPHHQPSPSPAWFQPLFALPEPKQK